MSAAAPCPVELQTRNMFMFSVFTHFYMYVYMLWVLGVYQNKTPVSRGHSPRVRAFCSDISRSNHGITILYPKSSSH